jgi:streptogramin lyase
VPRPPVSLIRRVRRILIVLLGFAPIVAVTAYAGLETSPDRHPCVTNYSRGFTGGPTHVTLGPDGNIWANEGRNDLIAKFDIAAKRVTAEYRVPKGTQLHDLVAGPDGKMWFAGSHDVLGSLDIHTGAVKLYPGLSGAGQPHMWWAPDGYLYISEATAGKLARFDPRTQKITASQYNLPPNSGVHSPAPLPDGSAWWGLERTDQLAHFNIRTHRFDRFISFPRRSDPHWTTYVPTDHSVWIGFGIANNVARYNLATGRLTYIKTGLTPASPANFGSFAPYTSITQMYLDAQGKYLWAATLAGERLLRVDVATERVKSVTCGLPVGGFTLVLTHDRYGRMWVSEPLAKAIGEIKP